MKVTILGCGSSGGVPLVGNEWGRCDPANPKNRRLRVSILVDEGETRFLVDTSPDCREQLLGSRVSDLTAVFFTHAHADHCHGIDELRALSWLMKKPIDIYADRETLAELKERFTYVFSQNILSPYYKRIVEGHQLNGAFSLGGITITPFLQNHGHTETIGYRFGDFAYSTDVKSLNEDAFRALQGIRVWVVDCVRYEVHPTHSHLDQTLEWIQRIKPEKAYLTHMGTQLDYEELVRRCPPGVEPAYDGLVISC